MILDPESLDARQRGRALLEGAPPEPSSRSCMESVLEIATAPGPTRARPAPSCAGCGGRYAAAATNAA